MKKPTALISAEEHEAMAKSQRKSIRRIIEKIKNSEPLTPTEAHFIGGILEGVAQNIPLTQAGKKDRKIDHQDVIWRYVLDMKLNKSEKSKYSPLKFYKIMAEELGVSEEAIRKVIDTYPESVEDLEAFFASAPVVR